MAKVLLQTATLVLKIKGNYQLPNTKNAKTATVKCLLKLLKEEHAEIQYLGYDFANYAPPKNSIENSVVIAINVIEDPREIDFFEQTSHIIEHFVRQIKKNTRRILLQKQESKNGFTQKQFDFYVRGIATTTANNRSLKQA